MKDKKKKIQQNNRKDFNLLYETLLSGGTYGDYKQQLQDRSMPQEKPQEITEDDVLQAWILGNDEESEQFASGGHMHQSYNSYLTRRDIENSVLNNPMFQQTSYIPDTSISGNLGFTYTDLLGNAKPQGNSDIADNWSGWQVNGQYDPSKGAWQGAGNSIMSSAAIAGTLMDWGAGMYDNTVNRVDNASNKIEAGINQVGAQNFGIGDTAYRASQYDNIQRAQNSSIEDNGGMSSSEGVLNGLKSIGQGAATGAQVGGLWGGIIGGIAGLGKGIGEWFLNRDAAERRMELNNLRAGIANSQVDQKYDLTNSNSNRLYNFSQLQQPYMAACGGKMKNRLASGGYINSHYDYITDPLVKVNAGGTHQENPNEGVQTSIAPDGQPNLVEEGETIINNGQEDAYVFSDRIVADDEILKAHLLPNKFAGKTYADISKELDKIIEEHKGSEIEERTFQEMIKRLQEAQEDQKYQEKAEEVAKFIDGLSDEQKEQLEQTMVEEAQAEQEQAMAEQQAMQEQAAQEQAAQEQQMQPEQAPEQVVEQLQEQAAPSRYDEMMSRAAITDAANGGMFQIGGIARTIRNSNRQPVHKSWTGLYDMFTRKPELQFSGFGGGEFGKAGASGEWGDIDYIQNTPVPAVTRTFDDAFAEARRNGQSTFLFNGKLYNTEIDPNYNSNAGKYRQEVVSPVLNIRKVYDSAGQEMDSTRVEPWAGQMPGWTEREYLDDKKKYTYIGSEPEWPDNSSDKKHSKGGHLHQNADTIYNIGYRGYNPYDNRTQIYADDRSWLDRNVYAPVRNWFGSLSQRAPEFETALTTLTPVGIVKNTATNNTDDILASSFMGGLSGADAAKYIEIGKKMKAAQQAQQDARAYDIMVKSTGAEKASAKHLAELKAEDQFVNGARRLPTRQENVESALRKKAINEDNILKSSKDLGWLWKTLGSIGILGTGAAIGISQSKDKQENKKPNQKQNTGKYTYQDSYNTVNRDNSLNFSNEHANGGHINQEGNLLDEITVTDTLGIPVTQLSAPLLQAPNENIVMEQRQQKPIYTSLFVDAVASPSTTEYSPYYQRNYGRHRGVYDDNGNLMGYYPYPGMQGQQSFRDVVFLDQDQKEAARSLNSYTNRPNITYPTHPYYYTETDITRRPSDVIPTVTEQAVQDTGSSSIKKTGSSNGTHTGSNKVPVTIGGWSSTGLYRPGTSPEKMTQGDKDAYIAWRNAQNNPIEITPREIVSDANNVLVGKTAPTNVDTVPEGPTKRELKKAGWEVEDDPMGFNWLRYAPAIGSGLQHLSDLLGITNRPDYTNANMYQRSIDSIPTINYLPIGSYINYSPIDETYQQNQLRAANNAARRAAIVNGGGNAGAALAALNAIGYNETNSLGDLGIKVADYNNQMGQKVAEHNLRINQINASNSLSAQEKNQAIAAEKARLNYNLAQMRQSIEDQNDIAKAMNYNNLMTNLGNIGRENFIMNQVNSNMGLYYGVHPDGSAYYKSAYDQLPDDAKKIVDEDMKSRGLTVKKGK